MRSWVWKCGLIGRNEKPKESETTRGFKAGKKNGSFSKMEKWKKGELGCRGGESRARASAALLIPVELGLESKGGCVLKCLRGTHVRVGLEWSMKRGRNGLWANTGISFELKVIKHEMRLGSLHLHNEQFSSPFRDSLPPHTYFPFTDQLYYRFAVQFGQRISMAVCRCNR